MRRISWKRGMRLTDDILRKSDECTSEFVGRVLLLASGGNFGLLPDSRPFDLLLNIGEKALDVESLSCLAVTKNGMLIDIQYDTKYTNYIDNHVVIPDNLNTHEFILTVNMEKGLWRETVDGIEEPVYTFSLLEPDTKIPDNSLPIGRIVKETNVWHQDDVDFVPPCLFVNSDKRYKDLLKSFKKLLERIDKKSRANISSKSKDFIRIFWPVIQQLSIAISKETDLMTPMTLLSNVQKCVSIFTCACDIENSIILTDENEKQFRYYVLAPYNYQDVYQKITTGLKLCSTIDQLIDKVEAKEIENYSSRQEQLVAPYITKDQLYQNCKKQDVTIIVSNPVSGAKVFYSTDGSDPSRPLPSNRRIVVSNNFNFNKKYSAEKDKELVIKLKAVMNGSSSEINTFVITLHKDDKDREVIPII